MELLVGIESFFSAAVSLKIILFDERVALDFFSGGFGPRRIPVIISQSFLRSRLGFPIVKSGIVFDGLILGLVDYLSDRRSIHVIVIGLLFCLRWLLPTPMLLILVIFNLRGPKSILALSQADSCLFLSASLATPFIVSTTISLEDSL